MRSIVTDVGWCVSVHVSVFACLSVSLSHPQALQKVGWNNRGMRYNLGCGLRWVQRLCTRCGPASSQWKRQYFGWHLPAQGLCRVHQYYQPCSVGGSSDAAFRCQYCGNLFGLLTGHVPSDWARSCSLWRSRKSGATRLSNVRLITSLQVAQRAHNLSTSGTVLCVYWSVTRRSGSREFPSRKYRHSVELGQRTWP